MPDLAANSAGKEIVRAHPARLRVMLPLPLPEAMHNTTHVRFAPY